MSTDTITISSKTMKDFANAALSYVKKIAIVSSCSLAAGAVGGTLSTVFDPQGHYLTLGILFVPLVPAAVASWAFMLTRPPKGIIIALSSLAYTMGLLGGVVTPHAIADTYSQDRAPVHAPKHP